MAGNKTRPTKASVAAFLETKAKGQQLADSRELIRLFREVTGQPPKMWGPGIVGFGSYHYVYESGREGDAPLLGFAPRKPELVIYLMAQDLHDKGLWAKLGKHRAGACCLYIKKLEDIDLGVLKRLAKASVAGLRRRYGQSRRVHAVKSPA
ncbi:MAG TPA: DUF1801 domain-containing protein [Steroidobacteraceae bacterium]|jgi:hypothetical protein|nr:DUF1801 domain-containing protein [Steroidobacteraceae bacterium]